jgi:hypothetical protein
VLDRARIREAPTTLVTTTVGATHIYLTIGCWNLKPDMKIVGRTNAGAQSLDAAPRGCGLHDVIRVDGRQHDLNILEHDDGVMLAEGLGVFRYPCLPSWPGSGSAALGSRGDRLQRGRDRNGGGALIKPATEAPILANSEVILPHQRRAAPHPDST